MDNFQNICGQDLAIKILKSAILKEHISHAYLFEIHLIFVPVIDSSKQHK